MASSWVRAQRTKWSGSLAIALMPPAGTFRTCASMRVPYATPRPMGPYRLTSTIRAGTPRRSRWVATAVPLNPPPTTTIVGPGRLMGAERISGPDPA